MKFCFEDLVTLMWGQEYPNGIGDGCWLVSDAINPSRVNLWAMITEAHQTIRRLGVEHS